MAASLTMRAWCIREYGANDVLRLEQVPIPALREGEILVKVSAAGVNPIDWRMRSGEMKGLFPVEFPRVLGRDCAGEIVESRSPRFRAGQRVLGINDQKRTGTHAEYAVIPDSQAAVLPPGVSEVEAAAIGNSGATAWCAFVEPCEPVPGMRVLIHAGAGSVGGIAVQLARYFGCEVFATCSARNLDYVKSLGAQRAIDYTREDFVAVAAPCDIVFDLVGGQTHRRSFDALKPGGILARVLAAPIDPSVPRGDVRTAHAPVRGTSERLEKLLALVAQRELRGQIAKIHPFAQIPAAFAASESQHSRGKNVITIP